MEIIASPIFGVLVGVLAVVAYARSKRVRWFTAILLLVAWGVGSLGSVLFVVLSSYIPQGRYVTAVLTIIVGAVLYVPWFFIGVPAIVRLFRDGPDGSR